MALAEETVILIAEGQALRKCNGVAAATAQLQAVADAVSAAVVAVVAVALVAAAVAADGDKEKTA